MVIGIDASRAVKSLRTGPENYSYEIIRHMLAHDTDNEFILYTPSLPKTAWPVKTNVRWEVLPATRLWSQLRLAAHVRSHPPDVLFIPSHVVPLLSNIPSVVTIHDLAYRYFPRSYSSFSRRYLNFSTSVSASKAKQIIVPSHSTKHDLQREYGVKEGKITVIPLGYDEKIFDPGRSYGDNPLENPYIFYVGRIEEKKNIRLLIDAFVLLTKEKQPVNLVLSGKNGYGFEAIQDKIRALPSNIQSLILQPGYLPQYDMLRYLQHAAVFAFPSQYEGFGLSVLEALALGRPVVCSNVSSLPEVVGDAALTLPPSNALSWAGAMSRILHQKAFTQKLQEKALHQAQKFSWERCATETLAVLLQVANAR